MVAKRFGDCPKCGSKREFFEQLGQAGREWDTCPNAMCPSNASGFLIDQSELQDFQAGLRELGVDPKDFAIEEAERPRPNEASHVTGLIRVTRRSTGRQMEYRAGSGSSWVSECVADVRAGHL